MSDEVAAKQLSASTGATRWVLLSSVGYAVALMLAMGSYRGYPADAGLYLSLGRALARGAGYINLYEPGHPAHTMVPPGYPWLLSLAMRVSPHGPILWKGINAIAAASLIPLTYRLACRCVPVPWAMVAAGVAALSPLTIGSAWQYMSDVVFAALVTGGLVLRLRKPSSRPLAYEAAIGLLLGLATLVRMAGLFFILGAVLERLISRHWKQALMIATVSLLLILPWLLHVQHATQGQGTAYTQNLGGRTVIMEHGHPVIHSLDASQRLVLREQQAGRIAVAMVTSVVPFEPERWKRWCHVALPIWPLTIVFIALVLLGLARCPREWSVSVSSWSIVYLSGLLSVPYFDSRYVLPLLPIGIVCVFAALHGLLSTKLPHSTLQKGLIWTAYGLWVGVFAIESGAELRQLHADHSIESVGQNDFYRSAAYLQGRVRRDEVLVTAYNGMMGFMIDRQSISFNTDGNPYAVSRTLAHSQWALLGPMMPDEVFLSSVLAQHADWEQVETIGKWRIYRHKLMEIWRGTSRLNQLKM